MTGWAVATVKVFTVKVLEVALAPIVTLAGTVAAVVLLLVRVTTAPPGGAAPVRVTVPVLVVPPTTLEGLRVTEFKLAGLTARVAPCWTPPQRRDVTDWVVVTPRVVTLNVLVLAPALTVTLAGTVATAVLLLERSTTTPPVAAAPVSVTVPVLGALPVTLVGLRVSELKPGGFTVSVAGWFPPPNDAVRVTGWAVATGEVVTAKTPVLWPPPTVMLAGTVAAAGLPLARFTTNPPVGAIPVNVTVAVLDAPPTTLVGLTVRELKTGASTVSVACWLTPPRGSRDGDRLGGRHPYVVTPKTLDFQPALTVTLAGTVAAVGSLLARVTTTPPAGATPLIVTIPVPPTPPVTLVGLNVTEVRVGGFTVTGGAGGAAVGCGASCIRRVAGG